MSYQQKKRFFDQMLTIYGRKPVLEALEDSQLIPYKLHLASSNKAHSILENIESLAKKRQVEIAYHSRLELSRISKNSQQDQGVCIDIHCPSWQSVEEYLSQSPSGTLIALDNITNPQNVGMIIRSACAGQIDGIILPRKGCAKLDGLVIKASAGTLFKAKLLRCDHLEEALLSCQEKNFSIIGLAASAQQNYFSENTSQSKVYVLGNESEGISPKIDQLCDQHLSIPMNNGVESLNVAVTAALLAYRYPF